MELKRLSLNEYKRRNRDYALFSLQKVSKAELVPVIEGSSLDDVAVFWFEKGWENFIGNGSTKENGVKRTPRRYALVTEFGELVKEEDFYNMPYREKLFFLYFSPKAGSSETTPPPRTSGESFS